MSQTLGETMMASFMASTKEIPDIFILVVVEGLTPLPHGAPRPRYYAALSIRHVRRSIGTAPLTGPPPL